MQLAEDASFGPGVESEADWARRVVSRQRQIHIGKARPEYKRYIAEVPEGQRSPSRPRTPDPHARISKRQFDRLLGEWRRRLHEYDDAQAQTQHLIGFGQQPPAASSSNAMLAPGMPAHNLAAPWAAQGRPVGARAPPVAAEPQAGGMRLCLAEWLNLDATQQPAPASWSGLWPSDMASDMGQTPQKQPSRFPEVTPEKAPPFFAPVGRQSAGGDAARRWSTPPPAKVKLPASPQKVSPAAEPATPQPMSTPQPSGGNFPLRYAETPSPDRFHHYGEHQVQGYSAWEHAPHEVIDGQNRGGLHLSMREFMGAQQALPMIPNPNNPNEYSLPGWNVAWPIARAPWVS